MGILDDVGKIAGLAGGLGGGNAALLQGVVKMLGGGQSADGLGAILQGFQKSGLGDAAASWVSTGKNLPVSPEQLLQGLGQGRVQQLAQGAGLSESAAASALASLLPSVIDKLTPDGAVPQGNQLTSLLGSVTSLFK